MRKVRGPSKKTAVMAAKRVAAKSYPPSLRSGYAEDFPSTHHDCDEF